MLSFNTFSFNKVLYLSLTSWFYSVKLEGACEKEGLCDYKIIKITPRLFGYKLAIHTNPDALEMEGSMIIRIILLYDPGALMIRCTKGLVVELGGRNSNLLTCLPKIDVSYNNNIYLQ